MRKKRTLEERLHAINDAAKRAGARHDLTMEQWLATLEYFGGEYEVIEHYLPIHQAGTTVSNCIPACLRCNILKDKQGHDLSFYQNKNVIQFIENKGVKISFHIHKYQALREDYVILYCEGCGSRLDVPGLAIDEAKSYIDQYFSNTGYAYIA